MATAKSDAEPHDIGIEHAPPPASSGRVHGDAAAAFLDKNPEGRITVTPEDNKRVLRRIDLVILPIMLTVYFLQGLDKATLSYASVFGLIDGAGLVGNQYSWLGSVVYLAQLVAQAPLAWLLVRLPIAKFISIMVLLWGVTLAAQTAAHTFGTLLVARLFLGIFEASVAPSFIAITQMWWRRREQTVRIGYWYAMNGFTNMFGSLITWGLGHIENSKLAPYQIIFLFFGILTVAFSFVMFIFMPDSPVEAKFLNDHDKLIAVERLRANQIGMMSRKWKYSHLKEAILDPKSWLFFALLFSISVPSGGISTFGPLIIETFGFNKFQTILFNIPFGFVQLVATVGGAFVAQKIKMKGPVIAFLCLPPIAGIVVLMVLPRTVANQAALLVGYYLISVYPGITPLMYSWSSQNTAGDTKRKVTNAILFLGASTGNVVGPLLYSQTDAPGYRRGLVSNLALFIVIIFLVGLTSLYVMVLNKRHAKKRVELGKSATIIDTSLDSSEEVDAKRQARANAGLGTAEGEGVVAELELEALGERAFEDLTDMENDEFVFVY
ncbi:MFS general substrate transporter [Xylariaceae sp. FL0255]|nr:MFS general substrate transporter [Xylariaceae sp. FL0255]